MAWDKPYRITHYFVGRGLNQKRVNQWFVRSLLFLLLTGGGILLYRQITVAPRLQAQKIQTVSVVRQSLPIQVSANGTIKPERSINISPKNAGVLKRLLVDVGDTVAQGQIIAYMDDSSLQGQLTQARGQLASAEASLQKAVAGNRSQDIAQAQAQLDAAQATLQQDELTFRQNQQLYASGALSQRDFENSRASRDGAQAQVRQAQQALALQQAGSRPEDISQARAEVISAQGNLQNIQEQINDRVIRAPFQGLVIRKYADPGAFVTPTTAASSENSATSSSILSLASTNQVVANVAETNIAQMQLGQKAIIKADAYPGKTFEGRIVEIAPQSTVTQNVTSFEVKASIADPQKLLRSGMNVDVEFKVGQLENALVIPTVAIVRQQSGTGVFVARADQPPTFTPIQTGISVGNQTEVRSGLKEGEQILLSFPSGDRPQSKPPGIPM
jgi:HlyD family secretion protein